MIRGRAAVLVRTLISTAWLASAGVAIAADATIDPRRAIAIAEDQRRHADLRGFLTHADSTIRVRAVLAVGRLQDSTSVPDLLPLLDDGSATVRAEVLFALGQIGHRSARTALEGRLQGGSVDSRAHAIEAIGKLADPASTAKLVRFLPDPAAPIRREAAMALWRIGDSTAVDHLLARRSDPDPTVRWRVIYALEKIVMPSKIVLQVALHLDDTDALVRAYAARTLGRQKSPRATAYVTQAVGDVDRNVGVNAIRALQFIADSTCATCLPTLTGALGHAHPYMRVTAATAMADRFAWVRADSAARANATKALEKALADSNAATRGAAARALIARDGERALERVRPLLADTSLYTRTAVITALTLLPPATATPMLLERLSPAQPLFVRTTSLDALGTLKSREALEPVRAALEDTTLLVSASAAAALGEMGDSASVTALAAAYARRVRDADADARIAIRDALRQLAGRAYADSIERKHPAPTAPTEYPADFQDAPVWRGAVLKTARGDIEWQFYGVEATQTVKNFCRLAERGYFDGLAVHRVVPNFVIQDGDPTGTGSGGPGYSIRCEYNQLRYEPGMVGMALAGKDTGGSQWFINHSPQPHLNGRYTIFARVTRGMEVVQNIVQGDRVLKVELRK
jgi:HEAT repeat protein/cyclophilin family peptidyl-prolyl cis-trans isomerase